MQTKKPSNEQTETQMKIDFGANSLIFHNHDSFGPIYFYAISLRVLLVNVLEKTETKYVDTSNFGSSTVQFDVSVSISTVGTITETRVIEVEQRNKS